jgi:hypothetical protein
MKRDVVKEAFRQAQGEAEPDVGRIVDAVPAMMAEARRRREHVERAGTIGFLAPLARRALPRLAAAAAILVVAATLVAFQDGSDTTISSAGSDNLMLTGELEGGSSDILLNAIAEGGGDDG